MQVLATSVLNTTGQQCFDRVAETLAQWLEADCILVGETVAGTFLKALAMRIDGKELDEFTSSLAGSVDEDVMREGFRFIPRDVSRLFPEDRHLQDLKASGYLGVAIYGWEGQPIGVLSAAFRSEVALPEFARQVMAILATKIATEVERRLAETVLHMNTDYLKYIGNNDALTGLPNRVQFRDHLGLAVCQAHKASRQLALLLLDLDRFKNINDSFGHETGDQVICEAARRLAGCVEGAGQVARFWGDEFTIVLDQIDSVKDILSMVEKIQTALCEPFQVIDPPLFLTTSIGIAVFPADAGETQKLIDCADAALSHAKLAGPNHFRCYSPEMNFRARKLLILESYLREAQEKEQLTLHYQPQIDMSSGRVIGMEALLRWQHPEQDQISPADFIPLAEETGLIVSIGEWVLTTACHQNKKLQQSGYPQVPVAVNISAQQFRHPGLVATVTRALAESGLEARYLELEITESVIMAHVDKAVPIMEELTGLGVKITIDDFGTGYSSLSYLKKFPITALKIDRSFVRDVTENQQDAVIASAIISLARSMRLAVIAEGVENRDQAEFFRERGCPNAQGYFFSKPLPAEELQMFLARGT